MEFLEFFAIVEADRDILNPISPQKLGQVAVYAGLRDGLTVLDIGSGKAAMLRQWARHLDIRGTGVEVNPAFVQEAVRLIKAQGLMERVHVWPGNALEFVPEPGGYDVITCLGASFALGSVPEALNWMRSHLKPGGCLILGETYLQRSASDAEVEAQGFSSDELPSLAERCAELQAAGAELVGLTTATTEEWDHYTSLMWSAAHRWATASLDHPHHAEVVRRVQEGRTQYLDWQREHVGWAVLVGRIEAEG